MAEPNSNTKILQIEDQIEAETIDTSDYYFCDVGAAISVMSDGSSYDTKNPPSKPLVISQRFGLLFVAHSKGFCVAKTKDVIAASKKSKGEGSSPPSVQELSVIDVLIGRVLILSLSLDSSFIAAVVEGEIQCFFVDSLLKKDKTPTFSCCVESNHVKDFFWIKETELSFISLTESGKLFLGSTNKPLKHVMDEVDAVGTSMDGSFVAVARKSMLSIFSPKFKEISKMSLPTDNWVGDSNTIKVDCIRWVRPDSIVVGCFQQTEDGNEENYFIQVITSKDGQFIDDSPKLVSVDFNNPFSGIVDDIVPCGCGPYLFVNYLEDCELAFVSNRKNNDQHVMMFNWSQEDNQVSLVYIERDMWLPRIHMQENGDDNLICGLDVDNSAVYENVKVSIDVEEERELPPHCVLVCLTLEGKLVMFYFASVTGSQRLSTASSNEKNKSMVEYSVHGGGSLQLGEESSKQSTLDLGSHSSDKKEITSTIDECPIKKDHDSSSQIKSTLGTLSFDQNIRKDLNAGKSNQSTVVDVGKSNPFEFSGQSQDSKSNLFSFFISGDTLTTEKLKIGGGVPLTDKPREEKAGSRVLNSTLTPTTSVNSSSSLGISNEKPLFSSQNFAKSTFSSSPLVSTNKSNSSGNIFTNFGSRPSDTSTLAGQAMNRIQSISGSDVPGSQLRNLSSNTKLQEVGKLQTITNQSAKPMFGNDRKSSPLRQGNSEPNLPEQFSNVQNMAKELDELLESIEEAGGFREACTTAHRSSLQAFEEAMDSLSERNRVCKSWTEERFGEIQLLLDKTVQVLARTTHMEGIVRQTTDGQYRDVWNRQKLSAELEQKRNSVLNRNQDLMTQMIELEKHFNTLELNLFGQSSGVNLVSRTQNSRSTPSRQSQSLHAIHNATISQLTAAKQLSDSLSKQMTVLSIKSPQTKHTNVKKQVFDSIGIPYPDDTLHSPNTAKVMDSPSNKLPLVSCSGKSFNGSRRISGDLETARRRRDSLDKNWANYEAPKTTVKRMVVENERPKFSGLFSSRDKQSAIPSKLEGTVVTYSKVPPVQYRNDHKDMPQKLDSGSHGTSNFKWTGGTPEFSQARPEPTPRWNLLQGDKILTSTSSTSSSSLSVSTFIDPTTNKDKNVSTPQRVGTQIENTSIFNNSGTTSSFTKPSVSQLGEGKPTTRKSQPPLFSFSINTSQSPTSVSKETESKPFGSLNFSNVSTSKKDFETPLPNPNIKTSPLTSIENESTKIGKDVNKDVVQFPSLPFSQSSSLSTPLSSLTSKNSNEPSNFTSSLSSVSSKSTEIIHTDSSESLSPVKELTKSTPQSESLNPVKELAKTTPQVESEKVSTENNKTSTQQEKLAPFSSSSLNFAQFTQSSPQTDEPKAITSNLDLNKSIAPISGEVSPPQKQSTTNTSTPVSPLEQVDPTTGKSNIETTEIEEDGMDEEAPETNQTVNQSLGNFGGFGLGSTPSLTTPKSNPFGGPITSTPQNMSNLSVPSGELFRPASFSFPSMQPSQQPSQPSNFGAPSSGFGFTNPQGSGFGQPSQIGSQQSGFGQRSQIGSGQQALGSVLGSFGQSRQLGTGLPGSGFGLPQSVGVSSTSGGFGGGFATAATSGGGFAAAASKPLGGFGGVTAPSGGGFGGVATPSGGGFGGVAASGGGFGGAAPSGGGFGGAAPSGGGFAGAAPSGGGFAGAAGGGGGFSAFGKAGGSGFSGFGGGGAGGRQAPPELFTQMRK